MNKIAFLMFLFVKEFNSSEYLTNERSNKYRQFSLYEFPFVEEVKKFQSQESGNDIVPKLIAFYDPIRITDASAQRSFDIANNFPIL